MSMYPIASYTVGSGGSSSFQFTSIPQTFTHLQIRSFVRGNTGGNNSNNSIAVQFNGDNGSGGSYYIAHLFYGYGTGYGSSTYQQGSGNTYLGLSAGSGTTSNCFNANVTDILDYTSTAKHKAIKILGGFDSNGTGIVTLGSGLWFNPTIQGITSMNIYDNSGYGFAQYSRFDLYGITASTVTGQ